MVNLIHIENVKCWRIVPVIHYSFFDNMLSEHLIIVSLFALTHAAKTADSIFVNKTFCSPMF